MMLTRRSVRGAMVMMLALSVAGDASLARAQSARKVTTLSEGVYVIEHRDANDGFAGGNTTVIIGDRQVLVVDAPFLPSDAREDIAQIRQWTSIPVTFLLNTHFHNDHNFGNRAYMDAFPALTVIAHEETKKDMDLFGPSTAERVSRASVKYKAILERGAMPDGTALSDAEKREIRTILDNQAPLLAGLAQSKFQSATLTFGHEVSIDLGVREVQIRFLGRGNTAGDAVAVLPKERIVVSGDLVVHPIPYVYDGYPSEWITTLQRLADLDAATYVPGHGPVLTDKTYLLLVRDLLRSAVGQMNEALRATGPALARTLDDVKGRIDLSAFRARFAGNDKALGEAFDDAAAHVISVAFREASLR